MSGRITEPSLRIVSATDDLLISNDHRADWILPRIIGEEGLAERFAHKVDINHDSLPPPNGLGFNCESQRLRTPPTSAVASDSATQAQQDSEPGT